jgi:Protein of unknown function (DUF3570)
MTKRAIAMSVVFLAVGLGAWGGPARAQEVTGSLRSGLYSDDDSTTVWRSLLAVDAAWSSWHLFLKESVDVISSASIDVRMSSNIDATSGASRVEMSDTRFETTIGTSHDDSHGHVVTLSGVFALEGDYQSYGMGLSGSYDLEGRRTTLLGSASFNHNIVGFKFKPAFSENLESVSYTVGVAQVLGASDAVRLRYDGQILSGYLASPYRTVRFGDWTVSQSDRGALVFANTTGLPAGLAENLPSLRVRHAAVLEWIHGFGDALGLLALVRLSDDSWSVRALSVGADLRYGPGNWLFHGGYRFYLQGAADFFQDKYVNDPSTYAHYASDKELGDERGHIGSADASYAFRDFPSNGMKTWLDLQLNLLYYDYPGFTLLPSRTSVFGELGLRVGF